MLLWTKFLIKREIVLKKHLNIKHINTKSEEQLNILIFFTLYGFYFYTAI